MYRNTQKTELTLTPSVFFCSRLLAAIEKKKKTIAEINHWLAGINICKRSHTLTHTHAQGLFKAVQLPATLKEGFARIESRRENANQERRRNKT